MDALLSAACRDAAGVQASSERRTGADEPGPGAGKPQLVLLGATMPPESALEAAVQKVRLRTHACVSDEGVLLLPTFLAAEWCYPCESSL